MRRLGSPSSVVRLLRLKSNAALDKPTGDGLLSKPERDASTENASPLQHLPSLRPLVTHHSIDRMLPLTPRSLHPHPSSLTGASAHGNQLPPIVGVISRSTILKLLENRLGFSREGGLTSPRSSVSGMKKAREILRKLDRYPLKAPTSRAGQEKVFRSLSSEDSELYINLSHFMQRNPYIIPANASLARTYRMFRRVMSTYNESEVHTSISHPCI